jgi:transcriptional regulator with XRE-family HTH domain
MEGNVLKPLKGKSASMANNMKELRLAFLLTPNEFAERLGVDRELLFRLEAIDDGLPEEWAEAVSRVLGVPTSIVTDQDADIEQAALSARFVPERKINTCRIAARFAIQAMVAKLGGMKVALSLDENDLETAVQNLINYAEDISDEDDAEQRANRLSQSLQIAVLTILQSRGVDPAPDLPQAMEIARRGALGLLQSFSRIDEMRRQKEME